MLTCPNVHGFDVEMLGELSATVDAEHLNYFHPASLGALLERVRLRRGRGARRPGGSTPSWCARRRWPASSTLTDSRSCSGVLIDEWDRVGEPFQDFLAANGLSSNMWLVARRA